MNKHVTASWLLFLMLYSAANVTSANEDDQVSFSRATFSQSIDALFGDVIEADAPGCSVGVIRLGELVHKRGYGLANLEHELPLTGSNVHRIASVSKQFTALAVLMLAEEGQINLEEDIRTYLPELMEYGVKVSINSMLGHFSGMADYDFVSDPENPTSPGLNLQSVAGGPFRIGNEDYLSISEFYDAVKKIPLRHPPNQKWEYSNLAYFLLSMLVEEVSGETLREYSNRKIFKPLGMTRTFFSDSPTEIVKDRASGYRKDDKGAYVTDMTNLFWVGDGGLHTNVDDMFKWDQHFYQPTLGKNPKKLMALFNKANSTKFKLKFSYANGQGVSMEGGKRSYSHSGGWLGVDTFYQRFPDQQFSTVVLCNDVSVSAEDMAEKINKIYFGR